MGRRDLPIRSRFINYQYYRGAEMDITIQRPIWMQGKWRETYKSRWAYLFIAPFYILFLIFGIYPLLFSFILSFTGWGGKGSLNFIGIKNYILLFKDQVYWHAMLNGVIIFFMYVPIMLLLATILADLLNSKRVRGFQIFRTLIFLPYITNVIAAGFVFQLLFSTKYGLFNSMLGLIGSSPIAWLDTVMGSRVALCVLIIWA